MDKPLQANRPEVVKSAMALKSKYTVQHRSDLLMKEHIRSVRSSQEALKTAIGSLDGAKSQAEIEQWTQAASVLKEKSDQMVLVLQIVSQHIDTFLLHHIDHAFHRSVTLDQSLKAYARSLCTGEVLKCMQVIQIQGDELEVMSKLNTELAYARADLNDALYKGQGDINAARKRVIWLEDKMGELCGKKRLKSRPINHLNRDYDTASDTDEDRPLDSGERFAIGERERTRSLAQILGSDFGLTSTDTETNRSGGRQQDSSDSHGNRVPDYSSDDCGKAADGTGEQSDVSRQQRRSLYRYRSPAEISPRHNGIEEREKLPDHRYLYASMTTLTSGQEDIAEESSGEFSPLKEVSMSDASDHGASEVEDDESQECTPTWQNEHHISSPARSEEISEENDGIIVESSNEGPEEFSEMPVGFELHHKDETPKTPQSRGNEGVCEEDEQDEENENQTDEDDGIGAGGKKEKANISEFGVGEAKHDLFLAKQCVKIASPRKDLEKDLDTNGEVEDQGAAYWQSEHHRFEYSNFSGIFGEVDPLSYHKVGLAVPGSFLKRSETDFTELPWKTTLTAKDIKDIHREALDKLALKVHNMQDKIYNAAMLSVRRRPPPVDGPPEASFLHNIDRMASEVKATHPGMLGKSKSMPVTSTQQLTQESVAPTALERQTASTSTPSRLVFYPKPIPPPQVLPITRTNLNKEFPQFASSFAEPDPEQRTPAERIVDQRNLMEETKLVLYRQKPKPDTPGPSSMERRFRKMIERDSTQSQKSSAKKVRSQFKMAAALSTIQTAVGTWKQIKPKSRGREYQGLRWERVKTIVHQNLNSGRVEERIDAAKSPQDGVTTLASRTYYNHHINWNHHKRQLGLLRCGDTMVFYALKERLHRDSDQRVRYEATKALILIGCWEDEVMRVVLKYLVLGNSEMRTDLINTLIEGKNVMYVDKTIPTFLELVKVLSHFCRNPDPEDQIAFNSAVLLGRLCIRDSSAEARLMKALEESSDSHIKSKALEILVKQLCKVDGAVVDQILVLLETSPVWKYRVLASKLLIALGPQQNFVLAKQEEIYGLLTRRLWDDPSSEVRLSAAKALTALGLFAQACEAVENRLEDPDEKIRAEAVVSVGTLGMKNERVIRLLLEMLELDSSEYVRLMIIRTFSTLRLTDRRVMRSLHEREKLDGPLARESKKALRALGTALQNPTPHSISSRSLTFKTVAVSRGGMLTPLTG